MENEIKKTELYIFINTNKLNSLQNTFQIIMNSDEDPVPISKKLFAMLDKVNDNTDY